MAGVEKNDQSRNVPSAEQSPEYGVADWADVLMASANNGTGYQSGRPFLHIADCSDGQSLGSTVDWWSEDNRHRYELVRKNKYSKTDDGWTAYTGYDLKVYVDFSRTFIGYTYNTKTRMVRKCDNNWKDVPGSFDPQNYEREMLAHLQTTQVDPSVSPIAPTNMKPVLERIANQVGTAGMVDREFRRTHTRPEVAGRVASALGRLLAWRSKPDDTK